MLDCRQNARILEWEALIVGIITLTGGLTGCFSSGG